MKPEALVIATGNPHKVAELRAIFRGAGVEVIGLGELGMEVREPEETGATFAENSAIKALSYAAQTGRLCLADDSGLEVDALDGAPGVISSHYATNGVETGKGRAERDLANNERLLRDLEGVPRVRRTARFVCEMCIAGSTGIVARERGTFEGRIGERGEVPRGGNGFGYDPLFVVEDGRTSAELSAVEKNARSHRGTAASRIAEAFVRLR